MSIVDTKFQGRTMIVGYTLSQEITQPVACLLLWMNIKGKYKY